MKTLLIPVDFSYTSSNTLQYVADLSAHLEVGRIILLHTHYVSVYSHIIPSAQYAQSNADYIYQERTAVEEQLRNVGLELETKMGADVSVETAVTDLPLLRAVHDVINDQKPDLLVLGSDVNEEESAIGEYVIELSQISSVPVLVVPSGSKYQKVREILVPCNLDAISQLARLQRLRQVLLTSPELVLLNVDPENKYQRSEAYYREQITGVLDNFTYVLNHTDETNTAKAVLDFARTNNNIQLIVALPGKHSFFYKLTHSSITEAIAQNARIPVLILKDQNN